MAAALARPAEADAAAALATNNLRHAKAVTHELRGLYAPRTISRALAQYAAGEAQLFDGAEMIRFAERSLMARSTRGRARSPRPRRGAWHW